MSTRSRRRLTKLSIWVNLLIAVIAPVAFLADPHAYSIGAVLRIDFITLVGLGGGWMYLRSTRSRP